ncbi:hypothetical protein ACRAWF_16755 [Streptomyces sp. L7]
MAKLFARSVLSTLSVRGRVSGRWRSVPVAVLDHDGERYLDSAPAATPSGRATCVPRRADGSNARAVARSSRRSRFPGWLSARR